MAKTQSKGLAARFLEYMINNKPDLLFAFIRNTRPNLSLGRKGPVFITRFRDVQEVLSRPDIFNVTYAPMMDPSVGPYMLGRDCTEINQRDKGIMRAYMRQEDLPDVRAMVRELVNEAVESQIRETKQIEVVSTISRMVPVKLTGRYFGFPGPDTESMFRWSRATQYDMFHNLDNDSGVHEDNIRAGREMRAYLEQYLPERKAAIQQGDTADDILSRLLRSQFPAVLGFDDERIIANIMGTLVGAIETSSAAIVQLLDQLFRRPPILMEAIAVANSNDDDAMYRYCWEALRFNPINPFVVRRCSSDYRVAAGTLRAKTIRAGATVLVSTRSAMRDARQIPVSNTFVSNRPDYHYMHLGYGMHTCLGDQVSRVQIPEIVKRILQIPGVRPVGGIDMQGGPFPEKYVIGYD